MCLNSCQLLSTYLKSAGQCLRKTGIQSMEPMLRLRFLSYSFKNRRLSHSYLDSGGAAHTLYNNLVVKALAKEVGKPQGRIVQTHFLYLL